MALSFLDDDDEIPPSAPFPFAAATPGFPGPVPPRPAPPARPSFLASLFGGGDPSQGGLLDVLAMKNLGRGGLLQAGLAMLEKSGNPSTLGEVVASGVRGGQQGYQQGAEQQLAGQQTARQQQMLQLRQSVMEKYRGKSDLQSMQGMLSELLALGDIEGAKPLAGYLANAVNAQAGRGAFNRPMEVKVAGPDGKPLVKLIDPVTLKELASYPSSDTRSALESITAYQREQLGREDRRFRASQEDRILDDYYRQTQSVYDVVNKIRGTLANVDMARQGDGAAKIDLLYTFITALDPNSAVREGEIALARMAASLRARAMQIKDQVESAGGDATLVPAELVDQMANILRRRGGQFVDRLTDERGRATRRGRQYDVDPTLFKAVPKMIDEEVDLRRYKK